jgi:uncharacterized membrane protein
MHKQTRPHRPAACAAVAVAVMFAAPLATASTTASAAAAGSGLPRAGGSCKPSVTRLPDLGHGGEAIAFSGGIVVGDVAEARGFPHPAIWVNGHLHVIRTPAIRFGGAGDINARGQILGQILSRTFNTTNSWELFRGRITILRNVPGSRGHYARRINNRGQIAGADGNLALTRTVAVRWDSATAAPVVLAPQPGDKLSFSKGINDRGQVAGDTDEADGTPHSAVWSPSGRIRVFSGAYGPASPGDLFVINNAGTSAGESFNRAFTAWQATIWSRRGAPADLGFLPGLNQSAALGLSGSGFVSGFSGLFDYTNFTFSAMHAFIWPGHGPLLTLPVPHLPYARSQSVVHQIGDNGTVVGKAGPAHGVVHAYVWTCAFQQAFLPPPPVARPPATATTPATAPWPAGPARWAAFRHIDLLAGD